MRLLLTAVVVSCCCVGWGEVAEFDSRIAADRSQADTNGVEWIDGTELPLESRGFGNVSTPFGRMPADLLPKCPGGIQKMSEQATGHYFVFTTDSDVLAVEWTLAEKTGRDPYIPPQGMYGVDIYRMTDNGWRFVKNGRLSPLDNPVNTVSVAWPGEGLKPALVYLPTRGVVRTFRIGIRKGARVERYRHPSGFTKPIVHYGTSIVHGGCASRPGLCFTSIVGRTIDAPYVNLGFSGCARLEPVMAEAMARVDAMMYVVDPVWNCTPELIRERCEPFLRELGARRPGVPILICEGGEPAGLRLPANEALKEVFDRLVAENSVLAGSLHYLSARGMIQTDGESTHDYCHPNDLGSARMGEVFTKAIRDVLLGTPAVRLVHPGSADTASVQSAIDEVWKHGGGTVRLESGDYRIGSVRLRSGVRVDLAENVRIFASRTPDDYGNVFAEDLLEPVAPSVLSSRICGRDLTVRRMRGVFCGYGVTNAWITGAAGSVIDGGNCYDPFGEEGYRGPHGVFLVSATNCQISGVTIRNAANYAVYALDSADLAVRDLGIVAGHDGVHVEGCDRIRIADCDFRTGDDSVAGFACQDVLVTNCILNSACSPIRLSGRDVLVTDCVADGPACYPHRWTLTDEEKRRGVDVPKNSGRRTVGCFFQGYSEDKVRRDFCPGNIVFRNVRGREAGRFLLVLAGLGGIWQDGPAISDVTFENVTFEGLDLPGVVVGKASAPMRLCFRNCKFAFKRPQPCLLLGRDVVVSCENVKAENVTGALFLECQDLTYDDVPEFPSWRLEPDDVRKKWGLPPLARRKGQIRR